jgi:hypothetical protein
MRKCHVFRYGVPFVSKFISSGHLGFTEVVDIYVNRSRDLHMKFRDAVGIYEVVDIYVNHSGDL